MSPPRARLAQLLNSATGAPEERKEKRSVKRVKGVQVELDDATMRDEVRARELIEVRRRVGRPAARANNSSSACRSLLTDDSTLTLDCPFDSKRMLLLGYSQSTPLCSRPRLKQRAT